MNVSEVNSNKAVYAQRAEQANQAQKQQSEEKLRARQTAAPVAAKTEPEKKPRPVVNTQGQTTGKNVNVTA